MLLPYNGFLKKYFLDFQKIDIRCSLLKVNKVIEFPQQHWSIQIIFYLISAYAGHFYRVLDTISISNKFLILTWKFLCMPRYHFTHVSLKGRFPWTNGGFPQSNSRNLLNAGICFGHGTKPRDSWRFHWSRNFFIWCYKKEEKVIWWRHFILLLEQSSILNLYFIFPLIEYMRLRLFCC